MHIMAQLLTLYEAASLNPLDAALVAIGFTRAQAWILMENDFVDYNSFKLINKKEVLMVADSYGKRSTVLERIQFGSTRLNRLVRLMHLVQDYARRRIFGGYKWNASSDIGFHKNGFATYSDL
jgi:hypothetical protein